MAKAQSSAVRPIAFYKIEQMDANGPAISISAIESALTSSRQNNDYSFTLPVNNEILQVHPHPGTGNLGVMLTITRNKVPPALIDASSIHPIPVKPGERVGEYCHLMIFKMHNTHYVGALMHQHSPTMAYLTEFLSSKWPALGHLRFLLCVHPNLLDKLTQMQEARAIRMSVTAEMLPALAQIDGDFAAAAKKGLNKGFERVEMYWTLSRGSDGTIGDWIDNFARKAILTANAKEIFGKSKLKIYGTTDEYNRAFIDLFAERLTVSKEVIYTTAKGKLFDTDDSFRAITEAYNENKHQIRNAAYLNDD